MSNYCLEAAAAVSRGNFGRLGVQTSSWPWFNSPRAHIPLVFTQEWAGVLLSLLSASSKSGKFRLSREEIRTGRRPCLMDILDNQLDGPLDGLDNKYRRKNENASGQHGLDVLGYMHDTMGTTERSKDVSRSKSRKVLVIWIGA